MTREEWIGNTSKEELVFRLKNECWRCGFFQQNFSGNFDCVRKDLERDCDSMFNEWKDEEM